MYVYMHIFSIYINLFRFIDLSHTHIHPHALLISFINRTEEISLLKLIKNIDIKYRHISFKLKLFETHISMDSECSTKRFQEWYNCGQ